MTTTISPHVSAGYRTGPLETGSAAALESAESALPGVSQMYEHGKGISLMPVPAELVGQLQDAIAAAGFSGRQDFVVREGEYLNSKVTLTPELRNALSALHRWAEHTAGRALPEEREGGGLHVRNISVRRGLSGGIGYNPEEKWHKDGGWMRMVIPVSGTGTGYKDDQANVQRFAAPGQALLMSGIERNDALTLGPAGYHRAPVGSDPTRSMIALQFDRTRA